MKANFQYEPYMKDQLLEENYDKLIKIESEIKEQLSNFDNFNGIDFCDVSAGGIQIRGHHKDVKGYTYGDQVTIKYDFSNYENAIDKFVDIWKKTDVAENLKGYKRFLADGARWGCD